MLRSNDLNFKFWLFSIFFWKEKGQKYPPCRILFLAYFFHKKILRKNLLILRSSSCQCKGERNKGILLRDIFSLFPFCVGWSEKTKRKSSQKMGEMVISWPLRKVGWDVGEGSREGGSRFQNQETRMWAHKWLQKWIVDIIYDVKYFLGFIHKGKWKR